jgi:hypothetical protein
LLLERRRLAPTNGRPPPRSDRETSMQRNESPVTSGSETRSWRHLFRSLGTGWLRLPPAIRLLASLSLFLLILTCAGCAVSTEGAPQTSACNVDPSLLEATPQPPLDDATVERLIKENESVRVALEKANGDKRAVKQFIEERCK